MTRKTILIFGISSFVGSSLAERFKKKYRVIGTFYSTKIEIEDVLTLKCDVHNQEFVRKLVMLFKPDFTIYAVGLSGLQDCHENQKLSDHLNTSAVFNVTKATELYRSRFIYISSAFVFSGDKGILKTTETPRPITVYGNSLASAEFYIQKSCLNYLIFRTGAIYGRGINSKKMSFLEKMEFASLKKIELKCDDKIKTNFSSTDDLSLEIEKAIDENLINQIIHIGSQDVMSQLEFAKLFKDNQRGTLKVEGADFELPLIHVKKMPTELFFQLEVVRSNYKIKESLKNFLKMNQKKVSLKLISQNA